MNKNEHIRQNILAKWSLNPSIPYKKLAKECKTTYATVRRTILRIQEGKPINDAPKSGRPKGPANKKLDDKVVTLLKRKPSMSIRDVGKKCGISHQMVCVIKKRNNIKTYKKQKVPKRSLKQQKKSISLARKLYENMFANKNECIVMDDETYVKLDLSTLPGPQFYSTDCRDDIPDEEKSIRQEKFGPKVLVWQAICQCGLRSTPFFTTGTINKNVYMGECLKKRLIPFIRKHNGPTLFWPDLATAHYAKDTIKWMTDNGVYFVPKEWNPPNVPELRPIELYWATIKRNLRRMNKIAENTADMKKFWRSATAKIPSSTVRNLMQDVKQNTRKYGRKPMPK